MKLSSAVAAFVICAASVVQAADVNVYSYRQPELIKPFTDAFTAQTGINVNVAYLQKGMVERMKAEGRRSPADVVLTVDISRLSAVVNEGLTQPVESGTLAQNVPELYRDPNGHWYGLTTRARIVYASKDRVPEGEVTTYEDLADPKWQGRICTRSGTNAYNVALTSAVIHHHGQEGAKAWLQGVKDNLARKPQGNDRAQVKAIWADPEEEEVNMERILDRETDFKIAEIERFLCENKTDLSFFSSPFQVMEDNTFNKINIQIFRNFDNSITSYSFKS